MLESKPTYRALSSGPTVESKKYRYRDPKWWENIIGSTDPGVQTEGNFRDTMTRWSPYLSAMGVGMPNVVDNNPFMRDVPEGELRKWQQAELMGSLGKGIGDLFFGGYNRPIRRTVGPMT